MTQSELDQTVDEVIKITTWRNIRRYVTLGGIAFVIADLIVTLSVVVILAADTRNADKARATAACKNTASLAAIQRANVRDQAKQTDDLAARGETLGLTKERFAAVIAESRRQEARFLRALDRLVTADCEDL